MSWKQIEHSEWEPFLAGFGREHDGWLVTVVTTGDLTSGGKARLRGARLDRQNGVERAIIALDNGDRHSLIVPAPTRILLDQDAVGNHRALAIEGHDRGVRLQFRVAIPPEMVDGLF